MPDGRRRSPAEAAQGPEACATTTATTTTTTTTKAAQGPEASASAGGHAVAETRVPRAGI